MSIIRSNRSPAAIPFHTSVPRNRELSKRELREMLAEAARNTATQARRFAEQRELGKPPVDPDAEQLAGELERGVG